MNERTLSCAALILSVFCVTSNATFNCTESGLFADPDSNDCRSYVLCNGSLFAQYEQCINGTYYSSDLKGCFSRYDCATKSSPYTTNPCDGIDYDDIPDKYSTDCRQYLQCRWKNFYSVNEELPQGTIRNCSPGTTFSPRKRCEIENVCSTYECNGTGDFANGNDCSTFIRCREYKANPKYRQRNRVSLLYPDVTSCPENTKFNPFLRRCDTFYKCDGIDPHGGVDPCDSAKDGSTLVPNPFDKDSTSYIHCEYFDVVLLFGDRMTVKKDRPDEYFYSLHPNLDTSLGNRMIWKRDCPADTFFSPILRKCYNNYNPNETCSKDACGGGPGKYVNFKSSECDSYIECENETRKFGLYQPTYKIQYCPEGTRFSPEMGRCWRNYVCPAVSENYCYLEKKSSPTTTG